METFSAFMAGGRYPGYRFTYPQRYQQALRRATEGCGKSSPGLLRRLFRCRAKESVRQRFTDDVQDTLRG
ncbi:hypothetical protein BN137_2898 [Cronobacter condimenti 1330]|uniref:Uncharacterized protein n=1 Tax=Cronobacter condimenti 1330 TaxID=1073999 RepID=K8A1W5_9ENTR|nr:hypothetical protein BN137_2898 [Cronobacter condimenti 1330]